MTEDNVKQLRPKVNQEKLAELIKRRDELLQENPKLQELQKKIDETVSTAGSENNRLVLTRELMLDSMRLLKTQLDELSKLMRKI